MDRQKIERRKMIAEEEIKKLNQWVQEDLDAIIEHAQTEKKRAQQGYEPALNWVNTDIESIQRNLHKIELQRQSIKIYGDLLGES